MSKERELIDLQSKREYTFLKLLKENQSLTRNTAEFVIGMSLRPAFGAGIGYSFHLCFITTYQDSKFLFIASSL